jgi:hypothetical protein
MSKTAKRISAGMIGLACLVCFALLTLRLVAQGTTPPPTEHVLAVEHPSAAIFVQMFARGGLDYFVSQRNVPASLAQIEQNGSTPYAAPSQASYVLNIVDSKKLYVNSTTPVWDDGQALPNQKYGMGLPEKGLFAVTNLPPDDIGKGYKFKGYLFPGAEYLESGVSLEEFPAVQRRMHLNNFIARVTHTFILEVGRTPYDFAELEHYIGTERNPAGWQGIQVVSSRGQVEATPGNFYFGPVSGNLYQAAINLGPEVEVYDFRREGSGPWHLASTVIYP